VSNTGKEMMPRPWCTLLLPFLLLPGCSDTDGDRGTVGALTADDAQQLNDAAEMLDASNRPPLPTNSMAQ
jgi:hypothetical protein